MQNDFVMDLLDSITYLENNNIEMLNRLVDRFLQENKEISEQFYQMDEYRSFMMDLSRYIFK